MAIKTNIFILLLTLNACGWYRHDTEDSHVSDPKRDELLRKYEVYQRFSTYTQDEQGFILTDECDSLIFSSLLGTTKSVKIETARDNQGAWHRRPLSYEECYPAYSGSSISRDMFIGVFWYIWVNRRLDLAQQIYSYGAANSWVMGEGDLSRTYMTPGLQATLAELIYRLGGEDHYVVRSVPQVYTANTGFAAHLDVLHILLRGEMIGSVNDAELHILEQQTQRMPRNGLFSYSYHRFTDGNQDQAITTLLDSTLFPADRLPTSSDRCEPWIWQRDEGSDWQPCGGDKMYSGGDYLFLTKLILGIRNPS